MAEPTKEELAAKEKTISRISQIIAAISPDNYADPKCVSKVKKLKKEGKFWEAVEAAKAGGMPIETSYSLSYNASMESLEPVYFWILDFLGGPEKIEKIVDNFISSPGSGHFSELMGKATRMQEESMKVMQTIGVLVKSVQSLIWDLKQFEIRLKDYKAAKSEKKEEAEAGIMALKQIWMDNVDIKRGNTSIKALTFSQASFATLIDAFMISKSIKDVDKLDLNERVKNILKQKYLEFDEWKKLSETELEKRYNIEKAWLKSQADAMHLYARWASPYLKAAEDLRMSAQLSSNAALIKAFNTILLQLTLLKKDELEVEKESIAKNLPRGFDKLREGKDYRKYYGCLLLDFFFRGIPQRVEQHYGFGGKSDVTFRVYALNEEELDELKQRLEESDIKEALKLVEGMTQTSLKEIEDDIRYFTLSEEEREKEKKKEEKAKKLAEEGETENINPFAALIGLGGKSEKKEKKEKREAGKEIKPDNYYERVMRNLAEANARKGMFTVYDVYKKAHQMASVPFDLCFKKEDVPVSLKDVILP